MKEAEDTRCPHRHRVGPGGKPSERYVWGRRVEAEIKESSRTPQPSAVEEPLATL